MKTILKCAVTFAVTLAVCFGLLCAACAVPLGAVRDNLTSSADKMARHDPHEMSTDGIYHSVCDNYADAVLFGVCANIEDVPADVIDARYYDDGYGAAVGIRASLSGYEPNVPYARYWHGSLMLIRPLLAVFDIDGIRITLSVLILLLFAIDAWMLFRRNRAAGVIFLLSAILTQIWYTCTTLEYMPVYIIMLAGIPLYIRYAENDGALMVLFAAAGTLTAFTDFLTAETLTVLMPLTVVFMLCPQKRDNRASLLLAVYSCLAWGISYVCTFLVKWIIASAATGMSIKDIALSQAAERASGLPEGIGSHIELVFAAIGANMTMLTPAADKLNIAGIGVWCVIFAAVCLFVGCMRTGRQFMPGAALILIAVLPLIRFIVLANHSFLHCYFTYRALMPSIAAVSAMVWYRLPEEKKKKRKAR